MIFGTPPIWSAWWVGEYEQIYSVYSLSLQEFGDSFASFPRACIDHYGDPGRGPENEAIPLPHIDHCELDLSRF